MKNVKLFAVILLTAVTIWAIVQTELPPMLKFFASIAILALSGEIISRIAKLHSDWGLMLLRTQKGIDIAKQLAKHEKFWNLFADFGLALAYGILSYFVIKRSVKQRITIIISALITITVLLIFVYPTILPFLSYTLGMPIGGGKAATADAGDNTLAYMVLAIVYLGGFASFITASLLIYAFTVISAVASTLVFGTTAIDETAPGLTLILPGINIPLFEGLAALIIILVVHEGAHAVLSVIGKIPILSSGIAFFGIIPIGAFVEPDEKRLSTKSREVQKRVVVAGSAANLMFSIVFFVLLLAFLGVTGPFKQDGWYVLDGMDNGTIIYAINGIHVEDLPENYTAPTSTLNLTTNYGEVQRTMNATGGFGIAYLPMDYAPFTIYNNPALSFIFKTLVLVFSLNFIIGVVNLLPLPFFDGMRLLELSVNNKKYTDFVMYLILAAFLSNLLPWFFK
ncbi:MAG: site-2 protease family protein [Candidatus ainarchaeum sp.]|nr:site-2 protease family protein [Candidatus ainarchaeum sp.]